MENIKELTPEQEKFSEEVDESVDTIVFAEEDEEQDSKMKEAIDKAKEMAGSQGAKYAGIGVGTGLLGMAAGYLAGKKNEAKYYQDLIETVTIFNKRFVSAVQSIETLDIGKVIQERKEQARKTITDTLRIYILRDKMKYTDEEALEAIVILGDRNVTELTDKDLESLKVKTEESIEETANSGDTEKLKVLQEGLVAVVTEQLIRKHVRELEIFGQEIEEVHQVKDMETERENIMCVLYELTNQKNGKLKLLFKSKKQREKELRIKEVLVSLMELGHLFEGIKYALESGIDEQVNAHKAKYEKELEKMEKEHKEAIKEMARQVRETEELNGKKGK